MFISCPATSAHKVELKESKVEKDRIARKKTDKLMNTFSLVRDVLEIHRKGEKLSSKGLTWIITYVLPLIDDKDCTS